MTKLQNIVEELKTVKDAYEYYPDDGHLHHDQVVALEEAIRLLSKYARRIEYDEAYEETVKRQG